MVVLKGDSKSLRHLRSQVRFAIIDITNKKSDSPRCYQSTTLEGLIENNLFFVKKSVFLEEKLTASGILHE